MSSESDSAQNPPSIRSLSPAKTAFLSQRGLVVRHVGGGGACLFRAIALLVYGDEQRYPQVRQEVVKYASHDQDLIKSIVELRRVNAASASGSQPAHVQEFKSATVTPSLLPYLDCSVCT